MEPFMLTNITKFALVAVFAVSGVVYAGEMEQDVGIAMNHGGHDMAMTDDAWSEKDDADFLAGMIAHHKGALDMTKPVIHATKDASVRKWAQAILSSQQAEIDMMQAMLDKMQYKGEEAAAMMEGEMHNMMIMHVSDDPDVNFVSLMIPHHAGAVDMSLPALVFSSNTKIRKLAEDIITAQAREIAEFKTWLDNKE
jgi:Uncharacterized protein conserved in bacteria